MTNDRKARANRAEAMRKEREKADRRQRSIISVAIVAIVVVLIAIAGYSITSMNKDKAQETKVIEPKGVVDGGVPYVPETPPANPAANPVVVETYEDFQCPGCAAFELNTNTPSGVSNGDWLRAQADTGRISLRFKPYSFLDGASTNAYSSRAMNVAMCALDENTPQGFWKLKVALFQTQPDEGGAGPENDALRKTAEAAGAPASATCVKQGRFIPWIEKQQAEAKKERDITGTPTVFIAGKVVQGPASNGQPTVPQQDVMEAAIAAAEQG